MRLTTLKRYPVSSVKSREFNFRTLGSGHPEIPSDNNCSRGASLELYLLGQDQMTDLDAGDPLISFIVTRKGCSGAAELLRQRQHALLEGLKATGAPCLEPPVGLPGSLARRPDS